MPKLAPGKESSEKTMFYVVMALSIILAGLSKVGTIDATPESANAFLLGLQDSAQAWFKMLEPWLWKGWAAYLGARTLLKGFELHTQAKVAAGQKQVEG